MSLTINTNVMSLMAANNLARSYNTLYDSIASLSSGLRINDASDDAAGLAIRELMRSEIAVLNQGIRNANDAISMLQTMDGAAQVIDEKLIRMKELAEQAATGTYSSTQRAIINQEFAEMRNEIERIAQATKFNGIRLLNSSAASANVKIHFGTGNASAEDYYYINSQNLTASGLGINTLHLDQQHSAQAALAILESAIVIKDQARAHFGAMMNRLENTVTNLTIQAENIAAAESRISDIDVALEMTHFMNTQIKAQAAVAMLAQANTMPQLALSLLGG